MTVYDEITDGEIDAESPWTAAVTFKMRNNPLSIMEGDATALAANKGIAVDYNTQTAILTDELDTSLSLRPDGAGSVQWAAAGSGSIGQAELKTATSNVQTTSTTGVNLTQTGGSYGFYPEIGDGAGGDPNITEAKIANNKTGLNESRINNIFLVKDTNDTGFVQAWQVYVTASKPYILNKDEGQIHLFAFLHMVGGKIQSMAFAEDPPWAYNGPTKTRPSQYKKNRKGLIDRKLELSRLELIFENYRRKRTKKIEIPTNEDILQFTDSQMSEYANQKLIVMVDQDRKNKDMDIIPHPFTDAKNDDLILMLDPPDTGKLLDWYLAGFDIGDLIDRGYIELINDTIQRSVPVGVTPVKFRWKNSGA